MTCFQVHCFFSFYLSKSVFEPSSEFFGSFIVFFTYSIFVWFLFFIVSISLLILSFCSYIFFLRFHLVVELCCLWALKNNYFDIFVGQFTDLHFFRVCYWRFIFFPSNVSHFVDSSSPCTFASLSAHLKKQPLWTSFDWEKPSLVSST